MISVAAETSDDETPAVGANEQILTISTSSIGSQGQYGPPLQTPIWNFFLYNQQSNRAVCQVSNCEYSNEGKNSTTLLNHLKKHKKEFDLYLPLKRNYDASKCSSAKSAKRDVSRFISTATEKWSKDDYRQKALEKHLAALFGATRLSHNFVTNPFFCAFVEAAQPAFNIPKSPVRVCSLINSLQAKMIVNMKAHLDGAKKVAVLLDLWTQASYKFGYLGVTVSFLSPLTGKCQIALLGIQQLNHPHTASRIRSCANHLLEEYGISSDRISRYLTDGGANMRKAYKLDSITFDADVTSDDEEDEPICQHPGDPNLDLSFDEDQVSREIEQFDRVDDNFASVFPSRLDCYSHKLMRSLAHVVDRDEETREVRKNILKMVKKFKSKSTAVQALDALNSKSVLLPARTRWNSFSIVIDRLLDIKNNFLQICFQEEVDVISDSDWIVMKSLGDILHPFKQHTDLLQGNHYPTIDHVIPSLLQLKINLKKQSFPGLGDLPKRLSADIASRFSAILDPSVPNFDSTFIVSTALSPSLALILDDDLLDIAQSHLRKMLRQEMLPTDNANITTNTEVLDCTNKSADSLFPDLLERAEAKRRSAGMQLSLHRQADAIITAYFDQLPFLEKTDSPFLAVELCYVWKAL